MRDRGHVGPREIIRLGVGMIWIAGAVYNAVWTLRHTAFLGDEGIARDAGLSIYRWFFGEVVSAAPEMWTLLLIAGELALGALTLASGRWARLGLWGGALWSLWLFPMLWPYTIMMGPYAMVLMWLARGDVRWGVRRGIDELSRAMRLPRGRGVRHA